MSSLEREVVLQGVAYADAWIEYQQALREIPGVVVAIRHEDDLVLSKGYGLADLERQTAMAPHHIFRIASHSKTFTATAVMQLVERGRLRLDDSIGASIPWLQAQRLGKVTVRGVLNHAAGIVRDGDEADFWLADGPFPDDAELRRLVEEGGEVLASNETFKYSNIGYSLLGLVVAAASGMSYNEYVTRNIVHRLGLQDTGPETNDHARQRQATGYTSRLLPLPRAPLPDIDTRAMSAATGFYSTAEDLCRYAAAHFLGNEMLLSDASKREMQQPYWPIEGEDSHYGLGLAVAEVGERRLFGHGGGFPGYTTRTWFDPHDRLVVVVLTNETNAPARTLADGIVKIIDFAVSRSREPRQEPAHRPERFVGRFVNMWGVVDVAFLGGALAVLEPDADDPVKDTTAVEVQDDSTLRITRTSGYGAPGERIRYLRDAGGQVMRIVHSGTSRYPLEAYRRRLQRLQAR